MAAAAETRTSQSMSIILKASVLLHSSSHHPHGGRRSATCCTARCRASGNSIRAPTVRSATTGARWAAGYGYIQPEVAGGIVMLPKLAETARDRVPGKREIRALWRAAGDDADGLIAPSGRS